VDENGNLSFIETDDTTWAMLMTPSSSRSSGRPVGRLFQIHGLELKLGEG
jgi:hypothetical protein